MDDGCHDHVQHLQGCFAEMHACSITNRRGSGQYMAVNTPVACSELYWRSTVAVSSLHACILSSNAYYVVHPVDQAQYVESQVLMPCVTWGNTSVCESSTVVWQSILNTIHDLRQYICGLQWATLTIYSGCKQFAEMHASWASITVAWQSIVVNSWQQSIYRQLAVS